MDKIIGADFTEGRGRKATNDMKNRISAMKNQGMSISDIIDFLWDRSIIAEAGAGYDYEYSTIQ